MKYCGKEEEALHYSCINTQSAFALVCTSIESVCMASARTQYSTVWISDFILYLDSMTGNFLRNMICLRWMVPWEAGSLISQRSAIIWNPI